MGNVALLLKEAGHEVKGSDASAYPPMSTQLQDAGVLLFEGYGPDRIRDGFEPDIQVVSNVLSKDHPEVVEGKRLGIKALSFPEVLEQFILPDRDSYVVAGTHGKTTTASLLSQLMKEEGCGYFVGGILKDGTAGVHLGKKGAPFVLEGDEYDTAYFDKHSKFLHYGPKVLILTHLEWDHVDIFPTFDHMLREFRSLIYLLPSDGVLVYCGDHHELRELADLYEGNSVAYGFEKSNDFQISQVEKFEGTNQVTITEKMGSFTMETPLDGDIYHLNALAAFLAASLGGGLPRDLLNKRLRTLDGAKRRLELIKTTPGIVISDFAHHPTAVRETLKICRQNRPEMNLVAVFDPRNATSRRSVFEKQMGESLSLADRVILAPVHQDHRLTEEERLDTDKLAESIGSKARSHTDGPAFVEEVLDQIGPETQVVIMSCGACYGLFERL